MPSGGSVDDEKRVGSPEEQSRSIRVHNTMAGGTVQGSILQIGHHGGPIVMTPSHERRLEDPDKWPFADEWQPIPAGVRRARRLGDDGIPPYVPRDIDGDLRERLRGVAETGGFVLLVGHSAAGKSRTAFEAVRAALPGHRVASPESGEEVAPFIDALIRRPVSCVLWLDDLDQFLGPEAFSTRALATCLRAGVVVVATMRTHRFQAFRTGGPAAGPNPTAEQISRIGSRVVEQADPVELLRRWTEGELERARQVNDVRIADAASHHGPHGVAEYLVAGPMIWSEWRQSMDVDGHPRGGALVSAGVALARTGLPGPYAEELLVELHEAYLEEAGGPLLRPEPLTDALAWATKARLGVSSPLLPAGDMRWAVFDYLVDETERMFKSMPIPDVVWRRAVEEADSEGLLEIAANAAETGGAYLLTLAESIWRPLAEGKTPGYAVLAAYNLGVLRSESGRPEEASRLFEQAAAGGSLNSAYNLGVLALTAGDNEKAIRWYRVAAEGGHPAACFNLAFQLELDDELVESENWYRRGAELGHHPAATNLGKLMSESGREDEAQSWYLVAAEAGDYRAAFNIGCFHHDAGRLDQAQRWYEQAIKQGSADAAVNLGVICIDADDPERAAALFESAAGTGDPRAMHNLGGLAASRGDVEGARRWLRRAAEAGHIEAIHALSRLLYNAGQVDDAMGWLERAAARDDLMAIAALGAHLLETDREQEALPYLIRAAEAGHIDSAFNLGALSANSGDRSQAKKWYRQAADAEDAHAADMLAIMEFEDGRIATAAWWSRRARTLAAKAPSAE
ncbi:SEL1-like repeat protein [Micromonospora lupini]|uniref:SEL1-like repeat protein n=1 Tax=Micromonospora lupini TaxID=285679 RepID=UPI0033F64806